MPLAFRPTLCAMLLALSAAPALAQAPGGGPPSGGGGFFDGFADFFGTAPAPPGAYVSPSARDLVPDDGAVGAARGGRLRRLEPIALPPQTDIDIPPPDLSALPAFAPRELPKLDILRPVPRLTLDAKLTDDGRIVPSGIEWRLFSAIPGSDGQLPLVAAASGGEAAFEIPEGSYVVHLAFGRAGLTKRVRFDGLSKRETLLLDAGGLTLGATAGGDTLIDSPELDFDIYSGGDSESERDLVASDVRAGSVVRLNSGTYHVVSHYGSVNAVVRADIMVEAGKITDATLQHHAAPLTFKLVREPGGEAMADTAWTIASSSGDVVRETVGPFASMVLAEGEYEIVATNRERVYQRVLHVEAGDGGEIEVTPDDLVSEPEAQSDAVAGSGD